MLAKVISRNNFSWTILKGRSVMKNVHTLTKNLLTGALLLLLLTIGALLATPQDAHAQSLSVTFNEPAGTQTTKTFKVPVTVSHVSSLSRSGRCFCRGDITVTTTRTQGSGDATVVSEREREKLRR